jgi:D-cysteine desulfhydrase family pyridoxal phosphate-dependent enzyme
MEQPWSRLPRVRLAHLPTPLEEMSRLSRELGGPRILIKRDDCTGLAIGGNKTRKLEFVVGDALEKGADVLITEGGAQSNHCRQTAAAAALHGLDCVLVLDSRQEPEVTGNLLLDEVLGARIVIVETPDARAPRVEALAKELQSKGRRPYVIPTGASSGIGAVGYVVALHEILSAADRVDAIVSASGSGGTQGGLVAGASLLGFQGRLIGISDGEPKEELTELVLDVATECAERLGRETSFDPERIIVFDEYAKEGYGVPNEGMVRAVRRVARSEGILLDPVYSGKAMAGLIDLVAKGFLGAGETVVFIHTGGTPGLFAYRDEFSREDG